MRQEQHNLPDEDPNPLVSLLRISSHLAGKVEIRAALRSVKNEIEQLLPIDHLDVCLIDDQGTWNTSYEVGLRTRWSMSRTSVTFSPIRTILVGETDFMLTENAMEDPRYNFAGALAQPILQHKLRSRVNVAMKVLGRTIGALNCSSRTPGLYDMRSVERVRQIADVLAPYFYSLRANEKAKQAAVVRAEAQAREEGLRQGALELTRALEQERQRIGMDLHDQTLADLTRIMRDLEKPLSPENQSQIVTKVQNCIQDLRGIIDTAVPSLLDMFGFTHALRIHLERAVSEHENMKLQILDETDGLIDQLDSTTRIAFFRIGQEAINNAARHSNAGRLSVKLTGTQGQLKMVVADNGRGLSLPTEPDHNTERTGGIAHMRTRANLVGADFHICSSEGTEVTVTLDLPNAQKPVLPEVWS